MDFGHFLTSTAEGRATREYRRHRPLYLEGDPASALYIIRRGEVGLGRADADGREAVVGIVGVGECFGEECLFPNAVRRTSAKVLTDCLLTRIDRAAATSLLRDHPGSYAALFACLVERTAQLEARLRDQLLYPAERRLACTLAALARLGTDRWRIVPRITQETLAGIVGMSRPRTCATLRKFREVGFIDWDRAGIKVRDSLRMVCVGTYSKSAEPRAIERRSKACGPFAVTGRPPRQGEWEAR